MIELMSSKFAGNRPNLKKGSFQNGSHPCPRKLAPSLEGVSEEASTTKTVNLYKIDEEYSAYYYKSLLQGA